MISFNLNLPDFAVEMDHLRYLTEAIDLRPAAEVMAREIEADNAIARAAGVDRYGQPFAPIAISTSKSRRRKGKGDGPPLAPDVGSSRIIANFITEIVHPDPFTWLVICGWEDMDFLRYHFTGTSRMPRRDPSGIRPEAVDGIATATFAEVSNIIMRRGI